MSTPGIIEVQCRVRSRPSSYEMVPRVMAAFILRKRAEIEAEVKVALAKRAAAEQTIVVEVPDPSPEVTSEEVPVWSIRSQSGGN